MQNSDTHHKDSMNFPCIDYAIAITFNLLTDSGFRHRFEMHCIDTFNCRFSLTEIRSAWPIRTMKGEGRKRVGSNSCPGEDEAP